MKRRPSVERQPPEYQALCLGPGGARLDGPLALMAGAAGWQERAGVSTEGAASRE